MPRFDNVDFYTNHRGVPICLKSKKIFANEYLLRFGGNKNTITLVTSNYKQFR